MNLSRMTARPARTIPPGPLRSPATDTGLQQRRYRSLWQTADGQQRETEQTAPALPLFDAAHSAFSRGTLITTLQGPVAVEDLLPGDAVVTAAHGALPVLWIGSMTLTPDANGPRPGRLTRIMADAFGMGRPMLDFMAGPGARILTRPRNLRAVSGSDQVLTPSHALADGQHAFTITPPCPVTLYHLCLRRHSVITANGLEVESFHPGANFERQLGQNMLIRFLSFFPHIREPHQFGPVCHLRLPLDAPDTLEVA